MHIEAQPGMPLACMRCGGKWPFEYACKMLPRDVAALYDSVQAKLCMEAMPGFLVCPYPDCTAGAIHDTSCPDFPCVRCQACSRPSCQACRTPWQQHHSCAMFSSSSEASRRTLRSLIEAGARRCPKCKYVVVKNGGCSRMQCNPCGATFSWKRAKLVDEGSDPDFPMPVGPTRSEQFQSRLRALLTRLRRRVQRVLSKPVRVAL
ncbi:hypothetical protein BFW01_g8954 [Lasiodiplodia theobromae]|nr:hypothetical protein BFW01_g8954 [Lasiodiplodia theobromae]